MFKKFLNLIKINKGEKEVKIYKPIENIENESKSNLDILNNDKNDCSDINSEIAMDIEIIENIDSNNNKKESIEELEKNYELTEEELEYIKSMKIKRGNKIKSIDVYSNEEIIFETHIECSKKLGVPLEYIKENLEYGYTDYFGESVSYLSKKLKVDIIQLKEEGKNILEIFNYLHNKLWNENISEEKREEILSSEKIESIKMHYKFEMLDNEYDDYLRIYGKLIKRGGKKKIELIDKKNEVIHVFKSLDECAKYFNKEKSEIVDRLKYAECKIGRYEIRYSLTR